MRPIPFATGVTGVDVDDALLGRERDIAAEYLELVVGMLSQRCWTQCHHSNALPDLFTTIFAENEAKAQAGIDNARELWTAILFAVRVSETQEDAPAALRLCLKDIFWKDHPYVKEVAVLLERCGWRYDDEAAREAVWPYAGSYSCEHEVS